MSVIDWPSISPEEIRRAGELMPKVAAPWRFVRYYQKERGIVDATTQCWERDLFQWNKHDIPVQVSDDGTHRIREGHSAPCWRLTHSPRGVDDHPNGENLRTVLASVDDLLSRAGWVLEGPPGKEVPLQVVKAIPADARDVYQLGASMPELAVAPDAEFMSLAEVTAAISDDAGDFLVLTDGSHVAGFGYARADDSDGPPGSGCLIYVAVGKQCRRLGHGRRLVSDLKDKLLARGVKSIYAWADPTSGIVDLLTKAGLVAGKSCVYMSARVA